MNCNSYQELSLPEKWSMIGKIVHLIQNDETSFTEAAWLIRLGEASGKLDAVKILPETDLETIKTNINARNTND